MTVSGDQQHTAAGPASRRTLALGLAVTALVLVTAGVIAVRGVAQSELDTSGDPLPTIDAGTPTGLAERVSPEHVAPLPDVTLEGFDGAGEVATVDYRGTPLVLNFWASWCAPCVDEMPDLQAVADAGAGRLAVLGVNVTDDPDKASELVASLGISYDLAVDRDGDLFEDIRGFGMPTTLFVDASGQIRYRFTGPLDTHQIVEIAEERLDATIRLPTTP